MVISKNITVNIIIYHSLTTTYNLKKIIKSILKFVYYALFGFLFIIQLTFEVDGICLNSFKFDKTIILLKF